MTSPTPQEQARLAEMAALGLHAAASDPPPGAADGDAGRADPTPTSNPSDDSLPTSLLSLSGSDFLLGGSSAVRDTEVQARPVDGPAPGAQPGPDHDATPNPSAGGPDTSGGTTARGGPPTDPDPTTASSTPPSPIATPPTAAQPDREPVPDDGTGPVAAGHAPDAATNATSSDIATDAPSPGPSDQHTSFTDTDRPSPTTEDAITADAPPADPATNDDPPWPTLAPTDNPPVAMDDCPASQASPPPEAAHTESAPPEPTTHGMTGAPPAGTGEAEAPTDEDDASDESLDHTVIRGHVSVPGWESRPDVEAPWQPPQWALFSRENGGNGADPALPDTIDAPAATPANPAARATAGDMPSADPATHSGPERPDTKLDENLDESAADANAPAAPNQPPLSEDESSGRPPADDGSGTIWSLLTLLSSPEQGARQSEQDGDGWSGAPPADHPRPARAPDGQPIAMPAETREIPAPAAGTAPQPPPASPIADSAFPSATATPHSPDSTLPSAATATPHSPGSARPSGTATPHPPGNAVPPATAAPRPPEGDFPSTTATPHSLGDAAPSAGQVPYLPEAANPGLADGSIAYSPPPNAPAPLLPPHLDPRLDGLVSARRTRNRLKGGFQPDPIAAGVQVSIPGPRRISVIGLKGGVGKTTLSVSLAHVFALYRRDPVLLFDADPTFGSLPLRTAVQPVHTVHDVAQDSDNGSEAPVSYLSRSPSGAWVLPSGLNPTQSASLDDPTYVAAMNGVYQLFPIMVTDCGAGLAGPLMRRIMSGSHTLVIATTPSLDGILATHNALRWIAQIGFTRLARNSIVALTNVPRLRPAVDMEQARQRFAPLCRGVVTIPTDPHLEAGTYLDLAAMRSSTRKALTHLGAVVLDAAIATG